MAGGIRIFAKRAVVVSIRFHPQRQSLEGTPGFSQFVCGQIVGNDRFGNLVFIKLRVFEILAPALMQYFLLAKERTGVKPGNRSYRRLMKDFVNNILGLIQTELVEFFRIELFPSRKTAKFLFVVIEVPVAISV